MLGCSGAKKEKSDYSPYLTKKLQEVVNLPEFAETVRMVEESIKNPGTDLDFTGCC